MKKIVESISEFLGLSANSSNVRWKNFVITAHDYLSAKQEVLVAKYKIGEYKRFDWDQEKGTLVFSNEDNVPVIIAQVQFVGSVSTQTKTWLWSWANGTILDNAKDQLHKVKDYGEEHHFKSLIKEKWFGNESDGWDMTSVTAYLLQAEGAYRVSADTGFTYMVITKIAWVENSSDS